MNETARKYVNLFRPVKTATAARAAAQGRPQQGATAGTPYAIATAHCLQCGRRTELCPAGAVGRLHP